MRIHPLLDRPLGRDLTRRAAEVGSYGDGSGRVTMLEGGVMPARFEGSDLSQRYPYAGEGSRHLQRGQFLGIKRVSTGGIKHHGYAVRALVEGGDGRALGCLTEVEGEHRLRDAQTRRFVGVQDDAGRGRHVIIIAVDPLQVRKGEHIVHDTIGVHRHLLPIVAFDTHLEGVTNRLIVELLKARVGIGEEVLIAIAVLLEDLRSRFGRGRVDDELGEVRRWCLRSVSGVETR